MCAGARAGAEASEPGLGHATMLEKRLRIRVPAGSAAAASVVVGGVKGGDSTGEGLLHRSLRRRGRCRILLMVGLVRIEGW